MPKKTNPNQSTKMGAPRKEIDFDKFELYLKAGNNEDDICGFFEITPFTLRQRISEHYGDGVTFLQLTKQKASAGRLMLRTKLFTDIMKPECSDTRFIFGYKVLTGFRENDNQNTVEKPEPTVIHVHTNSMKPEPTKEVDVVD